MSGPVRVELVLVQDCPLAALASTRLREALDVRHWPVTLAVAS